MSTHTLDLVPPDQDDMLSRLLWRTLGEVEILRLRRDELLAANNLTEEQRREAVRQCKVSRETIHVLQEALHARNETIAGFKTEISELRKAQVLFPVLDVSSRAAIATACGEFLKRGVVRFAARSIKYPCTPNGLREALTDELKAMASLSDQTAEANASI